MDAHRADGRDLPAFIALNRWPGAASLLSIIAALSIVHAINIGATGAMLGELFPRAVRATGGALVYSVGVAIFGGFAQFFVTWLIAATGNRMRLRGMRSAAAR